MRREIGPSESIGEGGHREGRMANSRLPRALRWCMYRLQKLVLGRNYSRTPLLRSSVLRFPGCYDVSVYSRSSLRRVSCIKNLTVTSRLTVRSGIVLRNLTLITRLGNIRGPPLGRLTSLGQAGLRNGLHEAAPLDGLKLLYAITVFTALTIELSFPNAGTACLP